MASLRFGRGRCYGLAQIWARPGKGFAALTQWWARVARPLLVTIKKIKRKKRKKGKNKKNPQKYLKLKKFTPALIVPHKTISVDLASTAAVSSQN